MAGGFLAQRLASLVAVFRGGAAGGAVLMLSAAIALVLANSPAHHAYEDVLALPIGVSAGENAFVQPLEGWINDALMAVFFLLVGLEIRGEVTEGQLASVRRAAAPAIAALGGMLAPAGIYLLFTWGDSAALRGWAIPMATDIAFSLAVLRLLGRRVPAGLRVFLSALAILDDLGAILVIALFYTEAVDVPALIAAALVWFGLFLLGRAGLRAIGPYMVGFVLLWACLARSGVHPTLAGVAVALIVPMQERDGVSPAHTLEHALHGWVAFVVLPLFGLANAGLRFGNLSLHSLGDPVVAGIVLGLFVGKQVGVVGATWVAARLGIAHLPAQLSWRLLYGAGLLCGIGFTMSLFIGNLAFPSGERQAELKLAVFAGSLVSALAGLAVLRAATRAGSGAAGRRPAPVASRPSRNSN